LTAIGASEKQSRIPCFLFLFLEWSVPCFSDAFGGSATTIREFPDIVATEGISLKG
jgi:hypothetical protein